MWAIQGKPADAKRFAPFVGREVLYDFDGPRIFTLVDAEGELNLVYWSDADENQNRFVVVPTANTIIDSLHAGGTSVFAALNQPRCWLCDVSHSGQINQCWRVDFDDIPSDSLPALGTMLLPTIEPELIDLEGRVRELDKDRRSFELREIGGPVPSQRFAFDDSLREEIYQAFDDEVRVKLAGRKLPDKPVVMALALSRVD
ncbi:MAG TPA: DUF6575 domain-containing protein [Pirellulales bacterium]|nr:DUF6575 domain-containing protein [Pirellulales bacterium]